MNQPLNIKKLVLYIGSGIVGVIGFFMLISMFRTVELGFTDVYQNTFTGNKAVYHGPDWYLSPVFVGKERTYKDETTIVFSKKETGNNGADAPIDIGFADTYEADLPLSVRFRLPSDDEHMFALDKSFRSYNNLLNSLYKKTTVDVSVGTATQFTAEEVFQGGLNGLKNAIENQLKNGLYVTERKRVVVSNETTGRVEAGKDKTQAEQVEQQVTVWKAVPKLNKDGIPLRMPNPFEQYGVISSQVTLELPHPEQRLNTLLIAKKESVAKKILSVQKQDNAKEDIKTAKLEGQAKRETAEQERLITADAEIIERKKEVDLAKLQAQREIVDREKLASLAIIDKKKELQIAKDNEGIQRANEKATKYQAQAKLHIGLAEAKIKKAKYDAVRQSILELEVEKVTNLAKYEAMKNGKGLVQMPEKVIINNGGGKGAKHTTLEDLANLKLMNDL